MIEEPPLLTINRSMRRPSDAQIAAFQGVPTGFVVDALFGRGALSSRIQPIGAGRDIDCVAAGPALTADTGPADIMATIAALNFIKPGDILVTAFAEHQGCAAAGDRVIGMLKNCGGAAFVTDGPVRDYAGIVSVDLPVWCTGLTPASPFTKGPGSVGFPVQLGGQQIATGDMVVADRDGVVIVPFDEIDTIIDRLDEVRRLETEMDAEVAKGLRMPKKMAEMLKGDQVKYID